MPINGNSNKIIISVLTGLVLMLGGAFLTTVIPGTEMRHAADVNRLDGRINEVHGEVGMCEARVGTTEAEMGDVRVIQAAIGRDVEHIKTDLSDVKMSQRLLLESARDLAIAVGRLETKIEALDP